jgi:hypothetical protein
MINFNYDGVYEEVTSTLDFLRLAKASELSLRSLNFNKVPGECLNPKLEPAIFILYTGF